MSIKCTMVMGDCLDAMPNLEPGSVNLGFADLPYALKKKGCSENKWDLPFPLVSLWSSLRPVLSADWSVIFTATQPFSSVVVTSAMRNFRHEVVWLKSQHSSPFTAKIEPLRAHESCLVFGGGRSTYRPQMVPMKSTTRTFTGNAKSLHFRGARANLKHLRPCTKTYAEAFPKSYIHLSGEKRTGRIVSAQKPVALLDWIIRTYSNPGDHVLDPVSGSGTTACAALSSGRSVTCIEKEEAYFEASVERVRKHARDNGIGAEIEVRR